MDLKISICMPTYNGARWVEETIKSVLTQSYENYEIIICDDNSTDNTLEIINNFKDPRIKIFKNSANVGYGKNLQILNSKAQGDILFLMGQDDILAKEVLSKTVCAFQGNPEIGVVTRPYYWFHDDVNCPVRVVKPYDSKKDAVISIFDGKREMEKIIESAGQLSGLAYRKQYMDIDFHEDVFPSHIYPFLSITKKYKVFFFKDYTVAVRIASSQTRFKSSIYDVSPTYSWIKMFKAVYKGKEYDRQRKIGINTLAKNYVGLIQLKNYSSLKNLLREIMIMVRFRLLNILDPRFWFFALGTIIVPREILISMTDNFKRHVIATSIKDVKLLNQ